MGLEQKYPDPKKNKEKSYDVLSNAKKELKAMGLLDEPNKEELKQKYGDID